jgi:hypothetical protein
MYSNNTLFRFWCKFQRQRIIEEKMNFWYNILNSFHVMQIHEAISEIEHIALSQKLEDAKNVLEEHLAKLPEEDYESRGTYFYYLLKISLRSHLLFENETEKNFYKKLVECFRAQEKVYLQKHRQDPCDSTLCLQITTFYNLMERYFTTLEIIYRKKEFPEAKNRAYLQKMEFRKKSYWLTQQKGKYFLYRIWEITSLYSLSFVRWGASCFAAVLFYGSLFLLFGGLAHSSSVFHWYDAYHFSIATFTTLGFGDVFPTTIASKIIADIEVFSGYLMLGAFMALVQKRIL